MQSRKPRGHTVPTGAIAPIAETSNLAANASVQAALEVLDSLDELTPDLFDKIFTAYFKPHLPSLLAIELSSAFEPGRDGNAARSRIYDRIAGRAKERSDNKVAHNISVSVTRYDPDRNERELVHQIIDHQPIEAEVEIPVFALPEPVLTRREDRPTI